MLEQRIKLLEDTLLVVQREVNSTLGEIQAALEGITKGNKMAFEVAFEKMRNLEDVITELKSASNSADKDLVPNGPIRSGREL